MRIRLLRRQLDEASLQLWKAELAAGLAVPLQIEQEDYGEALARLTDGWAIVDAAAPTAQTLRKALARAEEATHG